MAPSRARRARASARRAGGGLFRADRVTGQQQLDLGLAAQFLQQLAHAVIGQIPYDLGPRLLEGRRGLATAILDPQHGPAALGLEGADGRARRPVAQGVLVGLGHDVQRPVAQVAAGIAGGVVDRTFRGHGLEGRSLGQDTDDGLGLGPGAGQDQPHADFLGCLRQAHLFLVDGLDLPVIDLAVDDCLDQHVAEDAFARRLETALGQGGVVEAPPVGLLSQQFLVDNLVQHAAEQVARRIQRLTLADQTLRHRLAFDVGGPDGLPLNLGHGPVAGLGGTVRAAALAAGRHGEKGRKQDGDEGAGKPHRGALRHGAGKAPRVDRDKVGA
jgi:hypothetical protein